MNCYGIHIGVRANSADALERARDLLPFGWKPADSAAVDKLYSIIAAPPEPKGRVRRFNLLYGDHAQLVRSHDAAPVFETFETNVRLTVAEHAPERIFVHAGVVGWKGKAVLIPARTFAGKSTLVAALVRAGATYYSDEYAVIDDDGRVHPFHKPIEIRGEGYRQSKVDVSSLGGTSGTEPLHVGLVLITRYKAGATWKPQALTPGKAVMELFSNTLSGPRYGEKALSALSKAVSGAKIMKGVRGEASGLVERILDTL